MLAICDAHRATNPIQLHASAFNKLSMFEESPRFLSISFPHSAPESLC